MSMQIEWKVIHGKELGRTIGFRTANIEVHPDSALGDGTYEIEGLVGWRLYHGVGAYKSATMLFEAHFFDFDRDIYGETVRVTLLRKIRENMKFDSVDALKAQIKKDVEEVKARR